MAEDGETAGTAEQEQPTDSPVGWVAQHIHRYVETEGADGHDWRGYPTLLLTTTGRTTGQRRRTALIYIMDDTTPVIVASQGGAPTHPSWYRNLVAHPLVEVQIRADRFTARARTASPEDRQRLWPLVVSVYPPYDEYQQKTDREIPLVLLERADAHAR